MQLDWDNLIILDGCRLDTYRRVITDNPHLDTETLSHRISEGSASLEFLRKNFGSGNYHDTVYISSNPFTKNIPEGVFHAKHDLINGSDSYWEESVKTVPPGTMSEAASRIASEYPRKRIIIHFMQPHHPFLGESGEKIEYNRGVYGEREKKFATDPWHQAYRSFRNDHSLLQDAYRENLELVLGYIPDLIDRLEGKTVITSDHANLIGDRTLPVPVRGYGHPPNVHVAKLLKVPWHEFPGKRRKVVRSAPPERQDETINNDAERRLEYLGYR
ncbi:hypothetical protein ACFQE8_12845 [Salinirubellus sp. GCM10025818]|uniref:hypothetical protein n=1 Tax=Salinirubellus TaxID=2162630 RepID=UPI0030CAB726